MFAHFWQFLCTVVTILTFSSKLSNFENKIKGLHISKKKKKTLKKKKKRKKKTDPEHVKRKSQNLKKKNLI